MPVEGRPIWPQHECEVGDGYGIFGAVSVLGYAKTVEDHRALRLCIHACGCNEAVG